MCAAGKLQAREAYEEDRGPDECRQLRSEGQVLHSRFDRYVTRENMNLERRWVVG